MKSTSKQEPAILFSYAGSLESSGGGVQRCTRNYLDLLVKAGFDLSPVTYGFDQRLGSRLQRRLNPKPYNQRVLADSAERVVEQASYIGAKWIFLNHGDTAPLASQVEALAPGKYRFVLLSHGADSTDFLHEVRIRRILPKTWDKFWLGSQIFAEMNHRSYLHAVLCLSEQDLHLERWFGAKNALFLPQIASDSPLEGQPVENRIGTVCTLNHPPNEEGLLLFGHALRSRKELRLRLVGSPRHLGHSLAETFPNIDYLGPLDDHALAEEARTWTCFVNPIFCYGRGASTKLSQALGWQLPIATTRAGTRGYLWDESIVPLVETPEQLAELTADMARLSGYEKHRERIYSIIKLAPDAEELAEQISRLLATIQ